MCVGGRDCSREGYTVSPAVFVPLVDMTSHAHFIHRIIELEGAYKAIESNPLLNAGINVHGAPETDQA